MKRNLDDLKNEFIAKCLAFEREQHEMCDLKKAAFLAKLKSDPSVNQTQLTEKPLCTYFEQKLLIHSKVLPCLDKASTIVRIIFQWDDDNLIDIFYPMRGDKLSTIRNRAEFEDSISSP